MAGIPSLKVVSAVFAIVAMCGAAQTTQSPSAPPISTEAYAVYSVLLAGQPSRNGQHLAIADTTLNADDIKTEPDHEIQPPSDSTNAFYEAIQNYQAHREARVPLQRQLKLDHPYTLLTQDEVDKFRTNPHSVTELRPDASIARFSEVYFNPAQTAALVYIDHVCATPCGTGQWLFLEKQDGQWVRRTGSAIDRADTYAIYSLLLRDDPYPGLPQRQGPIAIADTTVNITDMNPAIAPDSQLLPPANNAKAFQEAVEDFRTRRLERMQLSRDRQFSADYTLLSPGQVQSYRQNQTGYPAINFFSEVYFNSKQTAALVYRSVFCGHLCANGQWIYLEKQGKQWVRRSGLNI